MTAPRTREQQLGSRLTRTHSRVTVFAVVAAQLFTGGVAAAWLAFTGDGKAGYSVLLGSLVGVVPGFYLALKIFGADADGDARRLLRRIHVAETVRIVFAVALFVTIILALDVSVPYVLVGYLITVLVNWFALLMPV